MADVDILKIALPHIRVDKEHKGHNVVTPQSEGKLTIPVELANSVKDAATEMLDFAREATTAIRDTRRALTAQEVTDIDAVKRIVAWIESNSNALSYRELDALLTGSKSGLPKAAAPPAADLAALATVRAPAYGLDSYSHLHRVALWFVRHRACPFTAVDPEDVAKAQAEYEAALTSFREAYDAYQKKSTGGHPLPYFEVVSKNFLTMPPGVMWDRVANALPFELIWCYWMEEGLLAQTVNAIGMRFQNRRIRRGPGPDPLFRFDLSPLTSVSNLLWSYIESEPHRTSVQRRAYEYNHAYGLALQGAAIGEMAPADPRSTFLGAFHNLLHRCIQFYRQDDDRMVRANAFPVLTALREVHLILGEGNHNQLGELLAVSRTEMMLQQYLLARPEVGAFLGGRPMTPYTEPWMDRIDTMKGLLGVTGPSIIHFHDLATAGERILLVVRNGPWAPGTEGGAKAFANELRGDVQRYVHAYRAVTGADLTAGPSSILPSHLIRRRLAAAAPR